ncbi:Delta-60 repeat-containing protein [Fluviicola taffensis]|uniref:Delta-60 repeat-containing protein n=1 Tax=Fluviicola taffensis (strain DSM 16823 / NCIMB 13979 / RW262) TaxID=755732 RepID=F2ICG8_FLUTR|nr:Delta-60 repeat-containing protein [Fluviicola taffensis]AEA45438.1 Delta-60 repeat-containing protein [Fluviicola taffensis DSM 16823]
MKKILLAVLISSPVFTMNASAQYLDSTFNTNGYLPYLGSNSNSQGNLGSGQASAIQSDGKIVTVLGRDNNSNDLFMYIYRYLSDGMPDPAFGIGGSSKIFCGTRSTGFDVEIQSDQKIVLIGESEYCTNGICGAKQFVMMRLKTNGDLDSTFGTNGHILTSDVFGSNGTFSIPKSLHILPNGKFMVGGRGPSGKPVIVRLNSNGFPDNTYGTNGVFSFLNISRAQFVNMAIGANGEAYGLLITDTWNQTAMSYDSANYTDNAVFKLTPTGTLDQSFGINGIFEFGTDNTDTPLSIVLASSGKLLVAGYNMPVNNYYVYSYGRANRGFVAFVNANGTLDMSIPNGFSNFDFVQDSATFFNKIIEKSPNEFLICGFTTDYVSGNFQNKGLIVSMNAQGQLNTAFNGNGYMIFDHGMVGTSGWNGKLANFMDVDITTNNKILLTGYRNPTAGATKGSIYILQLTYGPTSNLAVEELSNEADFSAYPNPVSNGRFMVAMEQTASMQLVALDGRILYQGEVSEGISQITFDSDYKGVAILKVETKEGKVGTRKMLFE